MPSQILLSEWDVWGPLSESKSESEGDSEGGSEGGGEGHLGRFHLTFAGFPLFAFTSCHWGDDWKQS